MTPETVRAIMDRVGWSDRKLAELLDVTRTRVQRWRNGYSAVPPAIAAWMEEADRWFAAHPAPMRAWEETEA